MSLPWKQSGHCFCRLSSRPRPNIDAGEIGTIRKITAELAHTREFEPESRFFNRSLGGGASLDLGIYCVALAMHFLGQPAESFGSVVRGPQWGGYALGYHAAL